MWTMIALIALGVMVLLLAGLAMFLFLRVRQLEQRLAQAQSQQKLLADTAMGIGKRLVQLQQDMQALADRLQQGTETDYKAYSQAAKLLQQGVPLDEVSKRCQLSRGEAELLAIMNRAAQGESP